MTVPHAATARAARLLNDRTPAPGDRLDAFLLLTGQESLWRQDAPGADFAEAVRQYEAATGRRLPHTASLPSFGAVKWCRAMRRREVAVWLAGRFLGRLRSPTSGHRGAEDWRADERLLVALGVSRPATLREPPRALLDAEVRVIELAREHVAEPGACV